MEVYFTQDDRNGDPPEEEAPGPGSDGFPRQSRAPRSDSAGAGRIRLIADDTESFEDQRTGIEASFTLKEEEIYRCLKKVEFRGARRFLSFLGAVLLLCPVLLFLAEGLRTGRPSAYLQAASWALLSMLFLFGPRVTIHSRAKNCAGGCSVRVVVYPDRVVTEQGAVRWEVPLDGTCEYVQTEDLLMLVAANPYCPGSGGLPRITILPWRCFGPGELPEVQAMIFAGARPRRRGAPAVRPRRAAK